MNKILLNIAIFIAKVIGRIWIYPVLPFRGFARNYVYNCVLQWNKGEWLGRLWQRNPTWHDGLHCWQLTTGKIQYRKVSKMGFWLVVIFFYMWYDDDANEDTCDIGYSNTIRGLDYRTGGVSREHDFMPTTLFYLSLLLYFFIPWPFVLVINMLVYVMPLVMLPGYEYGDVVYGTTFDMGDNRYLFPYFNFWSTLYWNDRNTAMNFQYLWARDYQ